MDPEGGPIAGAEKTPAELTAALDAAMRAVAEERAKRAAAEQRLAASESHGRELKRVAEVAMEQAAALNKSARGPYGALPVSHLISGSPARAGGFAAALLQPFDSAQAQPRSHPFAGARALPFTPMTTPATLPERGAAEAGGVLRPGHDHGS
jgi:hypothetical protein